MPGRCRTARRLDRRARQLTAVPDWMVQKPADRQADLVLAACPAAGGILRAEQLLEIYLKERAEEEGGR